MNRHALFGFFVKLFCVACSTSENVSTSCEASHASPITCICVTAKTSVNYRTIFVESNCPPIPTSTTATSTCHNTNLQLVTSHYSRLQKKTFWDRPMLRWPRKMGQSNWKLGQLKVSWERTWAASVTNVNFSQYTLQSNRFIVVINSFFKNKKAKIKQSQKQFNTVLSYKYLYIFAFFTQHVYINMSSELHLLPKE